MSTAITSTEHDGRLEAVSDNAFDPIAAATRTLRQEARAVETLADTIGADFVEAVDLIAGLSGRVVLSGMGKSGHVARKIAATLASTGTPAMFVHPGEASHGDLGMIVKGDAVVLLSNSGNTSELADITQYCKRFAIPMISITSNRASLIGSEADVCLQLPDVPEACPMGLAPTTSTTMMMALGDALAIALLERMGFTSDGFSNFHPGGRLGQKLLRVADLMLPTKQLPLVSPTTVVGDVLLHMTSKSYGCAIVVNQINKSGNINLLGIFTDGDLRRHMAPDVMGKPVQEIMSRTPQAVPSNMLAAEAVRIMNDKRITSLLVIDDQKLVGLIHIHDCLRRGVA